MKIQRVSLLALAGMLVMALPAAAAPVASDGRLEVNSVDRAVQKVAQAGTVTRNKPRHQMNPREINEERGGNIKAKGKKGKKAKSKKSKKTS